MIANYYHKGLEKFIKDGDPRGVTPSHIPRLKSIFKVLNQAKSPFELQGLRMHRLHSTINTHLSTNDGYAIRVTGNWRIVFRFDQKLKTICDVDYLDYH